MLVSCIIPHKGREALLERTLASVLAQDFDLAKLEIVVVTQNAALERPHIDRQAAPLNVIFRPEHETISTLRNTGVKEARGEYLVFLDADIQLDRNWLAVMFEELEANPQRVLISAAQRCEADAPTLHHLRVRLNSAAAGHTVQFLDGRNLFLRRATFKRAGGFPEHLVTCEDYYFTNRVAQQGEVYVSSRATYIHLGEDKDYSEMFRKEIWRGQSNLHSLRGRKIVLRELPSIITPLWQAGFLLLTIVMLLLGSWGLMGLAALLCIFPAFIYTARLHRLGQGAIRPLDALKFYAVYFPARIIGTILGLFKAINV